MTEEQKLSYMRTVLREEDIPFFDEETLKFYLANNDGEVQAALYDCLIVKAEESDVNVSGLSMADSSKYFLRLASRYRPNNSGILSGGE